MRAFFEERTVFEKRMFLRKAHREASGRDLFSSRAGFSVRATSGLRLMSLVARGDSLAATTFAMPAG